MKRFFAILLSAAMLISASLFVSCGDNGSQESGGGGDNYYTGGSNGGSSSGNVSDTNSGSGSSDGNDSESGSSGTTTTKLSAPIGLTAIATSSSSVRLSWYSVSGATRYWVYYSEYPYSSSSFFFDGTTSTSTTVTGLKANTKYYFWVEATNGTTTSDYSSYDYTTTWATSSGGSSSGSGSSGTTTTKLSAPTGLTATATSSSSIKLSWNSVSGATKYFIFQSEYSSSSTASAVSTATSTSTTVAGLKANTKYYFWVKASNGTTTSDYSSYAYATTNAATASWTPPTTYQELTNLGAENAIKGNVSAGNVYWFRLYAQQTTSSERTYTVSFVDRDVQDWILNPNPYTSDVVATYYDQTGTVYASNVDNGWAGRSYSSYFSQYLYVKVECKQSGSFAIYATCTKK